MFWQHDELRIREQDCKTVALLCQVCEQAVVMTAHAVLQSMHR